MGLLTHQVASQPTGLQGRHPRGAVDVTSCPGWISPIARLSAHGPFHCKPRQGQQEGRWNPLSTFGVGPSQFSSMAAQSHLAGARELQSLGEIVALTINLHHRCFYFQSRNLLTAPHSQQQGKHDLKAVSSGQGWQERDRWFARGGRDVELGDPRSGVATRLREG